MSILIRGMEMPNRQILAVINPNGLVEVLDGNTLIAEFEAISVPSHGRLIDADALMELYADTDDLQLANMKVPIAVIRQNIMDMPTIIEAEPPKEET
jgi:hypothetical protein